MPYPGGKHAPGHYVGGGAGGGGSFFSSPFVLYDGIYTYTGSVAVGNGIRFKTFNEGTLLTVFTGETAFTPIPDIPLQYFEGLPTPPVGRDWSVRESEDLGGDPYTFTPGPTGDWFRLTSTQNWSLNRPPPSTTVEHTSVYELALTADTSAVLARATIQVRYVRP